MSEKKLCGVNVVYPVKAIMYLCSSFGLVMGVFSTYHGIATRDLPFLTEAAMYLILFTLKFIILRSTKINLQQYHELFNTMREDFNYICVSGSKYREQFFKQQLLTHKVTILSTILICGIAVATVLLWSVALVFHLYYSNAVEERPLLFPLWSPSFDFKASPYYEIAFITFNIVSCSYAIAYNFSVLFEIVTVREILAKADILTWQLRDVTAGINASDNNYSNENMKLLKMRFKEIIKQHISMFKLIDIFSKVEKTVLIFRQELYAPVACFTAYSALEKMDTGESNFILILLCVSSMFLVFIPSYLCTLLGLKVMSICDACTYVQFWKGGACVRVYLILIMQRSLRPLPLRMPGVTPPSLETYSQKTTSAYSLFNMLRQLKHN